MLNEQLVSSDFIMCTAKVLLSTFPLKNILRTSAGLDHLLTCLFHRTLFRRLLVHTFFHFSTPLLTQPPSQDQSPTSCGIWHSQWMRIFFPVLPVLQHLLHHLRSSPHFAHFNTAWVGTSHSTHSSPYALPKLTRLYLKYLCPVRN